MRTNPYGSTSPQIGILIPTLTSRKELFNRVHAELIIQVVENGAQFYVGIFVNEDNGEKTTGTKRNELVEEAQSMGVQAIAFFDDDDLPGPTYIKRGLEFLHSGLDCAELWGNIYWNGKAGKPFHHFIECKEWWEDDKFYYRCPNHLNFMNLDKVKDFKFPDQNFGEDGQWSMAIKEAGVLKTQYAIPEVIYHYFNGEPKHAL